MSAPENPFVAHDTDALVRILRDMASEQQWPRDEHANRLHAAADRLELLYHATPSSASSVSPIDAVRREREFIEAQRSAFVTGVTWERGRIQHDSLASPVEAAHKFYPPPKVSRPLRVTLSNGLIFSREPIDDCDFVRHEDGKRYGWSARGIAEAIARHGLEIPADIRAFARILAGETELVDVECSPTGDA